MPPHRYAGRQAAASGIDEIERFLVPELARPIGRLLESYRRLEEAQRIAGLGHWSFSHACEPGQWSEDCFALLGLRPCALPLTYRRLARLVHPDDRAALRDRIDAAVHDARDFEIEVRLLPATGEMRWVRLLGQPVRDDLGVLSRLHGTVMDVTRRKLAELRQSTEHAVGRLLAESPTAGEVMPEILETLCRALGWACGAMWMMDRDKGVLARSAVWARHCPRVETFFRLSRHALRLPACTGLVGRALRTGQPAWIVDVAGEAGFPRAETARAAGLRAALAFPIQAGAEVLGIVELFADRPQQPDPEWMGSVHFIGRHIGQHIQREQAEAALRESEAHFRALVEQASDSFYVHDAEGRVTDVNQHACDSLGYSRAELLAMNLGDIDADLPQRRLTSLLAAIRPGAAPVALESRHRRRDGSLFPVEVRTGPIQVNGRRQLLSLVRDVTERKEMQDHIHHLAYHDVLTGLPNRAMFNRQLCRTLEQARRFGRSFSLLFIDLDRFKNINDTLGHDAGDRLLQEMARRLAHALRKDDLVARLGGDEFVVLIEDVDDPAQAAQVARQALAALAPECLLDGQPVHVTASIGISLFPQDGCDAFTLMKHADIAMYRAKEDGKNGFRFYSARDDSHSACRLALEAGLRGAIERGELVLHYQAKVEARNARIAGAEVLVRWEHPELGLLPPDRFIPLAEETGLVVPLTKWVLRAACAQHQAWRSAGLPPLRLAVNLSARHFADQHLLADVAAALGAAGMEPAQLELEITESVMMRDTAGAAAILRGLKTLGVHIALDDFGIGYSSLSHLKRLPIDVLKIDRSFITDIPGAQADQALAEAVIAIGKSLRMRVVAEGVEQEEQVQFLRSRGCDELQGYYFGRPIAAAEFSRLLAPDARDLAAVPLGAV